MTPSLSIPLPDIPNPYLEWLGARLQVLRKGHAEFSLEVAPQHLNKQGKLHGGVTASLLDVACGYAGLLDDDEVLLDAVTLSLSVSYLATLSAGRVRAVGQITGGGRSIYFVEASLLTESGELLARATGTFKRGLVAGASS